MNRFRTSRALAFGLAAACVSVVPTLLAPAAYGQTTISGDIAGTVLDPTGAAVNQASVVVTNTGDGSRNTATTTASGAYRIPLLKPGTYRIEVKAAGFKTNAETVIVTTGNVTGGDVKLTLGEASTVIEVTDEAPLLQTDNAQLSTTFNMEQIQTLPNPGGDITYFAQTAPGVVMNTGGGYGNFSVFGLPGTSNNFTVNGEQENDPFLNLNNSGPTNLLLGQNDISSVSVISSAYGAEFGSFGGAQINETSRSGNNKFHGDASYFWNGRSLNANNWFNKNSQVAQGLPSKNAFSNNNQWSAAIGGPIIKDRTFFFLDTEGIRFITANPTAVTIPSPGYQRYILGVNGQCNDGTGSLQQNGAAAQCAFYQSEFALYNGAAGAKTALPNPNANVVADPGIKPNAANPTNANVPDSLIFTATPSIFAKESLITARIDQVFGKKDTGFIHFKYDNGTQPTNVDPINPVFSSVSNQPEFEGQLVETHIFSPNLVNQFLATVAHYAAYFQNVNQAAATAALPFGTQIFAEGEFSNLGGIGYAFPQGRNATQYQFADDVSYTIRKNSIKVGYAFKKDDITNFDTGVYTHPLVESLEYGNSYQPVKGGGYALQGGDGDYEAGTAYLYRQTFPNNLSNPNNLYTEGFYAADTYKASDRLTITAGIRFEHNSNPVCPHACFSRINQDLSSFIGSTNATSNATAYNSVIASGQVQAFNKFQAVSYEPRFEIIFQPTKKTNLRAGFGMFSDVFPGQVADELLRNIPQDPRFQVQFAPLQPSIAGSGAQLTAQSNQLFKANYGNGASYNSLRAVAPAFVRPNIATVASAIQYPTYEEYSVQIQQELNRTTTIQLSYAGNHGYHEPVVATNSNAYYAAGFTGLPTARPYANFGQVTNLSSNASSNYNGAIVSIIHRSKIATAQINYTYSHTLDQVSNGGFLGFTGSSITGPLAPNSLQYNYGNADYDVRNSMNGSYLVNIPSYGTGLVKSLTGGFTVAGTVFYRAGFPFTVTASGVSNNFGGNYSGGVPALIVNKSLNRSCSKSARFYQGNAGTLNQPCLAAASFGTPTGFIAGQRNVFTGPHYFNTDLTLNKAFAIPSHENIKMILGINAYNVLNHPNFGNPSSDTVNGNLGYSFNTVSVPTSIYGSGLGGDASIRILQLHAKVSF